MKLIGCFNAGIENIYILLYKWYWGNNLLAQVQLMLLYLSLKVKSAKKQSVFGVENVCFLIFHV